MHGVVMDPDSLTSRAHDPRNSWLVIHELLDAIYASWSGKHHHLRPTYTAEEMLDAEPENRKLIELAQKREADRLAELEQADT